MNGSRGQGAGQGNARGRRSHAEHVVPAGMSEHGQSVVLGKKGDMGGLARTGGGMKGRGHAEQSAFHREAVRFQKVGKAGGRPEFLIAQFRFGKDRGGDLLHLRR